MLYSNHPPAHNPQRQPRGQAYAEIVAGQDNAQLREAWQDFAWAVGDVRFAERVEAIRAEMERRGMEATA